MTTILKNIYKEQNISVIKTNKFKNITINMRFALEFSVKRKAVLYLLSAMMFQSTKNYPDKVSFSKHPPPLELEVAALYPALRPFSYPSRYPFHQLLSPNVTVRVISLLLIVTFPSVSNDTLALLTPAAIPFLKFC